MQGSNKKPDLPEVPEHFLYWTFQEPELLRSDLRTTDGRLLKILSSGRRNPDNGPDFQDVVLEIGGTVMRGDVEFHIRWQDWFRHGHQHDRRYRQVILHGLWYPARGIPDSLTQKFPHFIISRFLRDPLSVWLEKMMRYQQDFLSKSANFPGSLPSLPHLKILAEHRFQRKCEIVRSWVEAHGWETALYVGLARALGYGKNSDPFTQMVRQLPPSRLLEIVPPIQRSPLLLWILLGWHTGLFDRPFPVRHSSPEAEMLRLIQHIGRQFSARLPYARQELPQWQFSRLRPLNNPYYRLAGYAQILYRYGSGSLFRHLLRLFTERRPLSVLLPRVQSALCLPLSPAFRPFFTDLLGFGAPPLKSMGVQRCRLFTLNILLPLYHLWAQSRNSAGFACYLKDLFFQFPAVDDNAALRRISEKMGDLPRNRAFVQQALLEYLQNESSPNPVQA